MPCYVILREEILAGRKFGGLANLIWRMTKNCKIFLIKEVYFFQKVVRMKHRKQWFWSKRH